MKNHIPEVDVYRGWSILEQLEKNSLRVDTLEMVWNLVTVSCLANFPRTVCLIWKMIIVNWSDVIRNRYPYFIPNNLNIRFNWSSTSLPGNKGRPAFANSAKIQPADHMSILVVYNLAPKRTSGGLYHRVTTSAE